MVSKIKEVFDANHNQVIGYTNLLNEFGIKVRHKNSYLISGKGNLRRLRVKLDRNNLFFLSDKIRDVSYCIGLIKLLKDGYYSKKFFDLTQVYEFVTDNEIEFDHKDNDVTNNTYENINPLRKAEHKYKAQNKVINDYWAN